MWRKEEGAGTAVGVGGLGAEFEAAVEGEVDGERESWVSWLEISVA